MEIRWHGRGGQGAVTAAKVLAASALEAAKHIQAFPEYGPERQGAPVQVFTRIEDDPIRVMSSITSPDAVVVLDPTLLGRVPFYEGMREGGTVVVNYDGPPEELGAAVAMHGLHLWTVDATDIAQRTLGRAITNTPMIGALVRATGMIDLETVKEQTAKTLGDRFGPEVVERNMQAIQAGYDEVRGDESG